MPPSPPPPPPGLGEEAGDAELAPPAAAAATAHGDPTPAVAAERVASQPGVGLLPGSPASPEPTESPPGADSPGGEGSASPVGQVPFSWKTLWGYTGPGFLMSIAYLDPGNIEADLQAGSRTGYTLLWVLLWATIMGLILQMMAVKLGVCSGRHLAEHCAEEFPRPMRYTLWVMAEIAIICVDCQEVIGTAIALKILSDGRIPIWAGVLLTALYTLTFLLMDRCVRKLEMMFGVLIAIMSVAFGAQYFIDLPPQGKVLRGALIPSVPSDDVPTAVGLIGAVIMPHNLYLHSALVLSRGIDPSDTRKVREGVFYNRIDSSLALLASFVINLFVVCVFAYCRVGDHSDKTIGLWEAGDRLTECRGGDSSVYKYIFAVGLLASGQAATVTSTYAGQYVMQGYLDLNLSAWKRAMLSRAIAIGPGLIIGVVAEENTDSMQEWLNVVQSVQLPFAIIPLLYFASCRDTLGPWANSRATHLAGWFIAAVVVLANIYLVGGLVASAFSRTEGMTAVAVIGALILFAVFYICLVGWLFLVAVGVLRIPHGSGLRRSAVLQDDGELGVGATEMPDAPGTQGAPIRGSFASEELNELTDMIQRS